MSFSRKDLDKFAESQIDLLEAVDKVVADNAIAWHKEHCINEDKDPKCEEKFMQALYMIMEIINQKRHLAELFQASKLN